MKPKLILQYNCGLLWQLPDGPIVKCTMKLYLFPEMCFKAVLCNDRGNSFDVGAAGNQRMNMYLVKIRQVTQRELYDFLDVRQEYCWIAGFYLTLNINAILFVKCKLVRH